MSDPAFAEIERERELNEGVHPAPDGDHVPMATDPAWTVYFRAENKVGTFLVRAPNQAMAERAALPKLAEGERIVRVVLGAREG